MAKRKDNILFYIIIVLAAISIGLSVFTMSLLAKTNTETVAQDVEKSSPWTPPDIYVKLDSIKVEGSSVIVTKDCKSISAQTTPERALGIFNALNNKISERPDVYESAASVLQTFGIKFDAVLVYRYEGETFFADSYFRKGNDILQLDMKPSDAMAIAIRTGAPIYYNKTLFSELGHKVC